MVTENLFRTLGELYVRYELKRIPLLRLPDFLRLLDIVQAFVPISTEFGVFTITSTRF